jgi:hypothetical protein
MKDEQRRKRPEHHAVHDYANLVSSGLLRDAKYTAQLLVIPTANTHVWHAFYANCRKMFEFFTYAPNSDYIRAQDFLGKKLPYTFQHWRQKGAQHHMQGHMMHVGGDRLKNEVPWTGGDDLLYLADFQSAWRVLMENLKDEHKDTFREEIDFRLTAEEFKFCGTLGKEFIL